MKKLGLVGFGVLPLVLELLSVSALGATPPARTGSEAGAAKSKAVGHRLVGLPLEFQPNRGQFRGGAQFVADSAMYSVVVSGSEFTVAPAVKVLCAKRKEACAGGDGEPLTLAFAGAREGVAAEAVAESGAYANYLVGNDPAKWRTRVPLAERIRERQIYAGIDLDFYGTQGQLEFDLTVAPGADAGLARLDGSGVDSIETGAKGELVLRRGDARFVLHAPVAYQVAADGSRQAVTASYRVTEKGDGQGREIGFEVGTYDHSRTLTIDPTVTIAYATYLGGSDYDQAMGMALDASGSVYLAGLTYSTDYPTVTPLETTGSMYVSKLNTAGTALVYSTYLGGSSGSDTPGGSTNGVASGRPLAVDSSGTVYLVGTTYSTDFPVTASAFQTSFGSNAASAGFLLRLSADGTKLLYSTMFGYGLAPTAVAVNNTGQAYMTGGGPTPDIPETSNAYYTPDPTTDYKDYGGGLAFLTEFDTTMSGAASLPYSTVFGHISTTGVDIVLDNAGNVDFIGQTGDVAGVGYGTIDVPGPGYETAPFNTNTTWLAKFSLSQGVPAGLAASTYLGGGGTAQVSASDTPTAIGVDGSGNIYATGVTTSASFPVYRALEPNVLTAADGFLTELNSNLQYLVYSTYIGDLSEFAPASMAVAPNGDVTLGGYGGAGLTPVNAIPSVTPPMTVDGNMQEDGALIGVASGGQSELYATYLGTGGGTPDPAFVVFDPNENVYFYGDGGSITPTAGAIQTANNSGTDPYLMKLTFANTTNVAIDRIVPLTGANTGVTTVNVYGTGFQTGTSVTLSCGGQSYTGAIFSLTNSVIEAYVDLRGAAVGVCDVAVTTPAEGTATAAGGFSVVGVAAPNVFAQLLGPAIIREGTGQVYTVAYGNTGNTDVYSVPLFVTFPSFLGYTLLTPLVAPPQVQGGMAVDYADWPADYNDGNGNTVLALLLPIVHAGSNNLIQIRLAAPNQLEYNDFDFVLSAAAEEPWEVLSATPDSSSGSVTFPLRADQDKPVLMASVAEGGALPLGVGSALFARDLSLTTGGAAMLQDAKQRGYLAQRSRRRRGLKKPGDGASPENLSPMQAQFLKDLLTTPAGKQCIADVIDFTFKGLGVVPGVNCFAGKGIDLVSNQLQNAVTGSSGVPDGPNDGSAAAAIVDGALDAAGCFPPAEPFIAVVNAGKAALSGLKATVDCGMAYLKQGGKGIAVQVRGPGDPNYKAGPGGAGPQQYIPGTETLNYSVNFANEPSAGASAQNVTATDTIDMSKVDLSTFAFGPVILGNHVYTPVAGATSIDTQLDLRPDVPIVAQINASLNVSSGVITWQFGSLDPTTDQPISTSSLLGFLPPDTTMPDGEVAVSFSANPAAGLTTGTAINNTARIVFDAQAAMATNTWTNTIDATAPVSAVNVLAPVTNATAVNVSWSGSDVGSGIAAYTIYVSDNGGPFTAWLTGTDATTGVFTGTAGHLYGFYTIATDAAGNVQAGKTVADTSTTLNLAASTTTLGTVAQPVAENTAVTLAAKVVGNPGTAGVPTGLATFYDAMTMIGSGTLDATGAATATVAGFGAGGHSISVSYGGDGNYQESSSAPMTLTVTSLGAPSITFSISNHTFGDAAFAVSANSASTGAFTYSVVSGPASIANGLVTLTGAGTVKIEASQAATASYAAGMQIASFGVAAETPAIAWTPTPSMLLSGLPLGAGVLDATAMTAGTFAYTATPNGGTVLPVTYSTVLPAGTYTLTVNFDPSDTTDYNAATASISYVIATQYVWVANSGGSLSSFDDAGNVGNAAAVAGGGVGVAVDSAGSVWSVNAGGSALTKLSSTGTVVSGDATGGGISGATALAIDGSERVWVANGNNSVSVLSDAGAALSPPAGLAAGAVNGPSGLAIDTSGNVWVANHGGNSVTEILGGGTPVVPAAVGVSGGAAATKP